MKTFAPPIRIIVPGRVYRRDNLDLSHTPMFQQFEGLVVGEGITLADLKGTLEAMLRGAVRRREASGCVRASSRTPSRALKSTSAASACGGAGCGDVQADRLARDPRQRHGAPGGVRSGRLRPRQVTGFAFGMGIERVAMLKYGVDDIRLFYENDLRFLEQFPHWMKVLLSWLRDFVDVAASPEEIAATMSVRGFAVEGDRSALAATAMRCIDFEVTGNRPDCMSRRRAWRARSRRRTACRSPRLVRGATLRAPVRRATARDSTSLKRSTRQTSTSSSRTRTSARATPAPSPT